MSTFLFSLTWQFNQFLTLLQALALFTLESLDVLPAAKVRCPPPPLLTASISLQIQHALGT
jgi:hypothetical protein